MCAYSHRLAGRATVPACTEAIANRPGVRSRRTAPPLPPPPLDATVTFAVMHLLELISLLRVSVTTSNLSDRL